MTHAVLEKVRKAVGYFEERADAERPGRLLAETVPQVNPAGVVRLMQPKGLGGALAADHGSR